MADLDLSTLKAYTPLFPMIIKKYAEFVPDQNASVLDQLNAIVQAMNQIGQLSNNVVKDWNAVYSWCMNDGLQTDVNNKIEDMKTNGELTDILNNIFDNLVGDMTTLHTTAKDKLVNSINEVDDLAKLNQTNIGDLTTLTTADKNTIVQAINDNVVSLAQSSSQLGILNKTSASILTLGADPSNSAAVNTTAIQNAFNAMVAGSTLVIPYGTFNVNNLTFNPPDDCTLLCYGTLVNNTTGAGVAFAVGNTGAITNRLNIQGLRVKSSARDWTAGRVGVKLINLYTSYLNIRNVYGFERNIECYATNNLGFVYNEFHLGEIGNSQHSLYLNADNGGWCNENNFYGGHFYLSTGIPDYTQSVHVTIINYATHPLNNNRFYSPSLETANINAKAVFNEGVNNYFYTPRTECNGQSVWTGAIQFTSNSQFNFVFFGYGVVKSTIVDSGNYNKLFTADVVRFNSTSSTDPNLVLKNSYSSAMKSLSIEDASGVERFNVLGTGDVWSNQYGWFNNGIKLTSGGLRGVYPSNGSPEGVLVASAGSIALNYNGGTGVTHYVKESGTGNTGWIPYQPIKSGTTVQRPSTTGLPVGYGYFDTSLNSGAGMEVRWNGTNWINPSTGVTV